MNPLNVAIRLLTGGVVPDPDLEVAGVLMDKAGDCWASGVTQSGQATLTYFKGCTGNGEAASFPNACYGQIDVYQYSASGITYMYSFNNGLNATNLVEGVAEAPRPER